MGALRCIQQKGSLLAGNTRESRVNACKEIRIRKPRGCGKPERRTQPWKKWGPYLSERQWGTVREDYSQDGNAWDYFSHDQARSRAYHWGEDGLAGISDEKQLLCFALALWNGRDPILKERLFGLTNSEGNHGEDVKEYYFYLDSTPTHSYMKYLYKYPQAAFPYDDLIRTNGQRDRTEMEYELLDTGVFDERPLLRRVRGVRQEYAGRHPDSDQRVQSRAGGRDAPCPADALVSQYLDLVAGHAEAGPDAGSGRNGIALRWRPHTKCWATASSIARRKFRCCSRRTRPTTSGSSARPTPAGMSKTGSTTIWSAESRMPSTRSTRGRRPPRTINSPWAPEKRSRSGCG